VGPDIDGVPSTYGTNVAPHLRWPTHVPALNITIPDKLPYDPNSYTTNEPETFKADLFSPPILRCPADLDPAEAHSYVLNKHLADKRVRAGRSVGVSTSDIVLMGEKKTQMRDYYMENSDFERLVEQFRHGVKDGSNYLFLDGSVRNSAPADAVKGIDPWDPPVEKPPDTGPKQ
jgi:prepilin-type processing-associated H-X9-DG protein